MSGFRVNTKFVTRSGISDFSKFHDGESIEIISHDKKVRKATVKYCGIQKLYRITFRSLCNECRYVFTTIDQNWLKFDGTKGTVKLKDMLYLLVNNWCVFNMEEYKECEAWSLHVEDGDSFILENNIVCCGC